MVFSGKGYVRQWISVMLALGKHLHVAFVHVPLGGNLRMKGFMTKLAPPTLMTDQQCDF